MNLKPVFFILSFLFLSLSCGTEKKQWKIETSELLFTSNYKGNTDIYKKFGYDITWINLTNDSASDEFPVWSPDGNHILFQSTRSGNMDIWIMNSDGSCPKQLTTNEDYDYMPAFTPDGRFITFTSWRKESGDKERAAHIYIMQSDGSGQRRLLKEALNTSAHAFWHPGGKKFLTTIKTGQKNANIYEVSNKGKIIRQVTYDTVYCTYAQYSPDGSQILYTKYHGDHTDIILMEIDGTNARTLLCNEPNYYPRFSPDGKWIVYTKILQDSGGKDFDIYATSVVDATNQFLLARTYEQDKEAIWNPIYE
jgi:TolB protein